MTVVFNWGWQVIWVFLIIPIHKIQEKRDAKWNIDATIWNVLEILCGTFKSYDKREAQKDADFGKCDMLGIRWDESVRR